MQGDTFSMVLDLSKRLMWSAITLKLITSDN
ncbi:hypothetical protein CIFRMM043B_20420 [Citrobacter freundii]|jgi:hypothetical protein